MIIIIIILGRWESDDVEKTFLTKKAHRRWTMIAIEMPFTHTSVIVRTETSAVLQEDYLFQCACDIRVMGVVLTKTGTQTL